MQLVARLKCAPCQCIPMIHIEQIHWQPIHILALYPHWNGSIVYVIRTTIERLREKCDRIFTAIAHCHVHYAISIDLSSRQYLT